MGYKEIIEERKAKEGSQPESEIAAEEVVTSKFFAIENLRNSLYNLELRMSDGNSKGVSYSNILDWNFYTSEGIELITATKKILITGRNLQQLYHYILAVRVRYIQVNIGNDLTEETDLFVKTIDIEEV